MSESLAERLRNAFVHGLGQEPLPSNAEAVARLWDGVAAEALAYVREHLDREKVAQAIYEAESAHLGIMATPARNFGDREHDIYVRAAESVLALLADGGKGEMR